MSAAAAPMRRNLQDWLAWQQTLHPREIDLSLERVRVVAGRLQLLPFPAYCISVAGTNGKGSCALMLGELFGRTASVGVYTSPYLLRYNERVRINAEEVGDEALCAAFAAVEAVREGESLTYFEFGTLAALWLFKQAGVDYAVLEAGMGGRLDAVNIIDADAALITSIGLDHVDWLGDNREAIGAEKAGIFRQNQLAVCADRDPPDSVSLIAKNSGINLRCIGKDFDLQVQGQRWHWQDWLGDEFSMPACDGLLADNVAGVLALLTAMERRPAIEELAATLPVYSVPGRRQIINGDVPVVLDVAHNAEAMQVLADWLKAHPVTGTEHIVLGMLANKPVAEVGCILQPLGQIYAAGLAGTERGLSGAELASRLAVPAQVFATVDNALQAARRQAQRGDRIVVCGSFYTLAAVLGTDGKLRN